MNIPEPLLPLKEALDKSSSVNRNLGLAFVSFLVYVLVVVVSTTDYQLLVPEEGVNLPILNFELPLFGFYIVAPALILILHLNLLVSLLKHSEKLYEWKERIQQPPEEEFTLFKADGTSYQISPAGQQGDLSKFLSPFMFNYLVGLTPGTFTYQLVRLLVYVSVFLFPLGLLVYVQVRFSDYQSFWMTGYHFLLVWVDIVVLGRYIQQIFPGVDSLPGWAGNSFGKDFRRLMRIVSVIDLILIVWISSVSNFGSWTMGPHLDLTDHTVLLKEALSKEFIMKRVEEGIPVDSTLKIYGVPLNLEGRSLRFVDFTNVKLFGVKLDGAHLQGANFFRAQLWGADLSHAHLQGANFFRAQLLGADLSHAHLQGADLNRAHLQGANLNHAHLQGADLGWAQLHGADFQGAQLQGANLSSAQLQRAAFTDAKLQGADLSSAELQGANLYFAQLQGADLSSAELQGAALGWSQLQGADLSYAQVQGADLEEAQLQGADLKEAQIQGSWLLNPSIQLDSLCGCSWDSSFVVIDSIQDEVEWDSLIQSILPSLDDIDTTYFVRRMNQARRRDSVAKALAHNYQQPMDTTKFLAYRANMGCRWKYDMRRLFIIPWGVDHATEALVYQLNRSLEARIEARCPDKLEGVDLSNYLD